MDPEWSFGPAAARVELLLAKAPAGKDAADLVDPFLVLNDRGAFSRVLLAEVTGPTGERVLPVAIKLQSDEYPLRGEGESPWNNAEIEAAWGREVQLLERHGTAAAGLPKLVEMLARQKGEPARLPPTIFCKRRRAFFTACCPECGEPMSDVRDGRLLEDRGLPRHDASLSRYIGCPACLARGDVRLWTLIQDARSGGRGVGDQADLFQSLGRLARTRTDEHGARLPCQGCDHVDGCYPESAGTRPEVVRHLTPLTFYESQCFAVAPLHFRYDEFAALLGGAEFDELRAEISVPGRVEVLRTLEGRFAATPAYLFAADMAGKLGLEVLRLKLTLFRQLCAAVAGLHRHAREPHLSLTPDRVMVRVLDEPAALPTRWNFEVQLLGLGNVAARSLPPGVDAGLPAPSYRRPRLIDPVFAAPPLRQPVFVEQAGTITLERVTPAADGRVVVEAGLESDVVDLAAVLDKDVVEVSIVQGRPPLSLTLVATPTGHAGRTLRLRTGPMALEADVRETVTQLVGQSFGRARFTVHPCLHVPCDVHSLGMMLLTSVLGHAGRSPAEVAASLEDTTRRLVQAAADDPRADAVTERALRLLRTDAAGDPYAPIHLFAHPDAHEAAVDALPETLWEETILLGLRAVTTLRDFSICRSYADFDPGHPEVKVEFLLQLVDTLVRKVDTALFGLPGRGAEIRAALDRVVAELKLQ